MSKASVIRTIVRGMVIVVLRAVLLNISCDYHNNVDVICLYYYSDLMCRIKSSQSVFDYKDRFYNFTCILCMCTYIHIIARKVYGICNVFN